MALLNNSFVVILLLSMLYLEPNRATRVLHEDGDHHLKMNIKRQAFQSLPRGPVPPSEASGCTYIPGGGGSSCPLNEKHFSGRAFHRGSAYPRLFVSVGVASASNH
ncbi:hypothetical protein UlMin_009860 [Ulmus minor]